MSRFYRKFCDLYASIYGTFGNHRIYQLQPTETESVPNVIWLLSAETECPPKVPIYPHSVPKPKPKPKFGRPLLVSITFVHSRAQITLSFVNCCCKMWLRGQLFQVPLPFTIKNYWSIFDAADITRTVWSDAFLGVTHWLEALWLDKDGCSCDVTKCSYICCYCK